MGWNILNAKVLEQYRRPATDYWQALDVADKAQELQGTVARSLDPKLDIGRVVKSLIILAHQHGYSLEECLESTQGDNPK